MANMFASVSGDGYLKIWNVLHPQPITTILAHPESEVIQLFSVNKAFEHFAFTNFHVCSLSLYFFFLQNGFIIGVKL